MSTVIIDYGVGNIGSLMGALDAIRMNYVLSGDPAVIEGATAIILPGVGAFAAAMDELKKRNLVAILRKKAASGTPFMGICLGMQLLFDSSEENGHHEGLGLIEGTVNLILATVKIPHMGWNSLDFQLEDAILKNNNPHDYVYYVHSYYVKTAAKYIVASSDYGVQVPGIVRKDNIIGMQFHPEKSSEAGLNLLRAFKALSLHTSQRNVQDATVVHKRKRGGSMKLFPAIDIKDKYAVRLSQGDFNQKTVYNTNPLEVAQKWQAAGSEWLHLVDLDSAKDGVSENVEITREIISQTDLKVQLGGGIRSAEHVKDWIDAGLERVIIGSAAVGNLPFVEELVQMYGDKICIGVDAKDSKVATHGWLTDSGVDAFEFCQQLEKIGVGTVVYTDIAKDGMMQGPNFEAYEKLVRETNIQIIASGGVSRLEDLIRLAEIGVYGVILGKSLYEGAFTLEEAIACLQEELFRA